MNYSIEGKVVTIGDKVQITDNFAKREIVIETDDKYPQQIMLEFTQDKCNLLDECKVNDMVLIGFNVRGREWNGKYFTRLEGWNLKIDKTTTNESINEINDDLPF
jgi:single-strand DNA-binding protein